MLNKIRIKASMPENKGTKTGAIVFEQSVLDDAVV